MRPTAPAITCSIPAPGRDGRRARLMTRTALCGALALVALGARPAAAQVAGMTLGGAAPDNTNLAANSKATVAPTVSTSTKETDITLNAPRTIIDWSQFDIAHTETAKFLFNGNGDIVVNRVAGPASTIDGSLLGRVGAAAGGNIWVINSAGVIFGQHAQVDVGGLLATTSPLATSDTAFINGTEAVANRFDFGAAAPGSSISVQNGAQLTAHGGALALIAPQVSTAAGATISAPGGDVLYGAADAYSIQFAPNADNDLDLFEFIVGTAADGTASTTPLTLGATTSAGNVYMAVVNQNAVVGAVVAPGDITATAAAPGGNGDIILTAGASLANGGSGIAPSAVSGAGATNVTLSGAVAAGQTVTINTAGAITQSGGALTAATLTGSSGGDVTLGQANHIGTLGDFTGGGAFSLTNAGALTVGGTTGLANTAGDVALTTTTGALTIAKSITAGTHTLSLTSAGAISQSGGVLTAATLTGSSGGNVTLGQANQIGTLADFTGGGAFSLTNAATLTVGGTTGLANTSGDVTLTTTSGNLVLAKSVNAGTNGLALTSAGTISQSGGALTAATLTGSSGGDVTLGQANHIGTLADFTGGGAFSLSNAAVLTVGGTTGLANTSGDVTLTTTSGNLVLAKSIDAGTQGLTLTSAGTISQSGGVLTAANLTGSSGGDVTLGQANQIGMLGDFTGGGAFSLTNAAALTVGGTTGLANTSGDVALTTTSGALAIAKSINAGAHSLTLTSAGTISQSGGVLTAATLTGSSGGDVTLGQANQIGTLGDFTGGGAFSLTNAASLTVGGTTGLANTAGDMALTTISGGNLILATSIDAGTHGLTLTSAGTISQSGGVLTAATLTGSSGGNVTLGQANQIGTLGDFTGGGTFSLTNAATLTVGGTTGLANTAGDVALTTTTGGNLILAKSIDAGSHGLALTSAGTISQTGGIISAAALTGSSGGNVTLGQANQIGTLGDFTGGGAFSLTNGATLTVGGTTGLVNTAGDMALTTTGGGDLTIAKSINAGTHGLTLTSAGAISQSGGTVTAATLTGSSGGATSLTGGNAVAVLDDFTSGGAFSLTDANRTLTVSGAVTAGGALSLSTTGSGNLVLDHTLGASGQTLQLVSAGTITQTAGSILTAGQLQGASGGAVTLGEANHIATLGDFTGGGTFTLINAAPLTVGGTTGLVNTSGDVSLTTTGGGLTFAGSVDAGAHTLVLSSSGGVSQTGGTITAAALTGSAAGAVSLARANAIATLGPFTVTSGGLDLHNGQDLTLGGALNAAGQTVNLAVSGAIGQTAAGVVAAATLTGSSGGDALFTADNAVSALGAFTSGGGFSLSNHNHALTFNGPLNASGAVALSTAGSGDLNLDGTLAASTVSLSSAGAINQLSGSLSAGTLNAHSAADLDVNASVSTLGSYVSDTGSARFTSGSALTVSGPVQGQTGVTLTTTAGDLTVSGAVSTATGTVSLAAGGGLNLAASVTSPGTLTLTSAGTISQSGGVLTAATLTGSSGGNVTLGQANQIGTLGDFTGGGTFSLTNAATLTVGGTTGLANTAGDVALTTTTGGNLILAKSIDAGSHGLALTSAGTISQTGGIISAAALTGSSGGNVTLGQANQIGTLGDFTGGGAFSLTNGATLTVGGTTGLVNTAGDMALTTTGGGDLTIAKSINAGTHGLTLTSAGAISQSGGTVTAATLTGSSGGATSLTGGNAVAVLDDFTSGGAFSLTDANRTLTVSGAVTAGGALSLSTTGSGNLVLDHTLGASGQTLQLVSAGTITQTAGSILTAGQLQGASGGAVTLGEANHIATLGDFTGGGTFTLINAAPLTVGGTTGLVNTSGDVSLTTTGGGLTFAGSVDAGAHTLALSSSGGVSQTGGTITAAALTGSAAGAVSLARANAIATLGPFTVTSGGLDLHNGQDLTLGGALNAAGQTVNLAVSGAIGQTAAGVVAAATLTGSSGGDALFTADNAVSALGAFTSGGGFSLSNHNHALTFNGPLNASGAVALSTAGSGDLNLNGTLAASTVSLSSAGAINQLSGSLSAGTLNAHSAADLDVNATVSTLGSYISDTGSARFTSGSALTVSGPVQGQTGVTLTTTAGDLTVSGAVSTATGTVSLAAGGGLNLAASVTSPGTLSLSAGGDIRQSGGTITADILTGAAGGSASLTGANAVPSLGAFSTGGAFSLTVANRTLTVNSPLTTGAGVNLVTLESGDLVLANAVGGAGQAVTLNAAGAIRQTAGAVVTAGSLSGSATTGVTLDQANQIAALGDLTVSAGGVVLRNGRGLNLAGRLAAEGQTVDLVTAGALTQDPGAGIIAASLTGGASGGTNLAGANQIGVLGGFTNSGSGGFALNNGQGLTLAGLLDASGQAVVLNVSGVLAEAPGAAIQAASLAGSSAGGALLDSDGNSFTALNGFTNTGGGAVTLRTSGALAASDLINPGGDVSVTTGGSVTLTGQVQADDFTLTAGGALQAGGAQVSATTLSAVSNGGADFGEGSAIGTVSGLHNLGSGAVVIRSSTSLRVADVTNAGGSVTVQTGGDLVVGAEGAGLSAQTDLTLAAAGSASIASARAGRDLIIQAGALTLSTPASAGRTASIRTGSLALDASLSAGQEIDIASTRGGLMLGGAAADGAAGLGLSAAEFARLGAPSVTLYAGDPQGTARGDLTVGDLQVDPAKVGRLALLAGGDSTVTVSGALTPVATGLGGGQPALVIGAASQASGWTPKAILVTGSIGSGVVNSPLEATNGSVKAFQSVELNAAQDIVLGTPGFVSVVRSASAVGINVSRSQPAAILAAPAPAGKLFLATGVLTLRAGGKLVQQNTAILPGDFSGVLVANPARAAVPIVLGRPGSGAPGVMDLFATFVDAQGAVISDKIAAASSAIRLDGLSGNANYRVNSCVIAQPGTCTPITTMIINVQPTRFTDTVAIRTQAEDADTDPTITGAGNEEIWRNQE